MTVPEGRNRPYNSTNDRQSNDFWRRKCFKILRNVTGKDLQILLAFVLFILIFVFVFKSNNNLADSLSQTNEIWTSTFQNKLNFSLPAFLSINVPVEKADNFQNKTQKENPIPDSEEELILEYGSGDVTQDIEEYDDYN
jgi:hypothetical protein